MNNTIQLTIIPTDDILPDLRTAIVQLCIAAHQEEDFQHLFSYIPAGGRHFLMYQDQELASHAVVTTRWLQPEGHPKLKTAYVDAVATHPAHQGQGYGSALMRFLATNIADYDIACLETDRISFYARLGWQEWQGPLAGKKDEELIPTPEQTGIMILRLPHTPPLDLKRTLTIEHDGRLW